ncbi:pilus assembly protein TadG-related protein [Anaerobaca lacustris]|uniref:Pilus assembly protein TadG-related protein n=1 Tax=Anaerobaca lacustris TaxID=3044600 RepID=A0AAW6U6V9_9BACT|nr:pilus assembly protein TadG-related protein [Sedimentisphaerales bacterium M17dextr]
MRGTEATAAVNRAVSGRRQRLRRRFPKGIALVWAAMMILVMLLMVGLGIDMGKLAYNVHQLQNAADAAALAGAQVVRSDPGRARDLAQQFALANYTEGQPVEIDRNDENDEAGDLVFGYWNKNTRVFTATSGNYNAVKVVARRTDMAHGPVALIFGSLVGINTADISREAIATAFSSAGAGIIALYDGTNQVGLEFKGTPTAICEDGFVQVNSRYDYACSANGRQGREALLCEGVNVCGDPGANSTFASFTHDGEPITINPDADKIDDPLEGEPRPGTAGGTPGPEVYNTPRTQSGTTLHPGYYPDGLKFTGNATYTLLPGVYILGDGLDVKGRGTINAQYCQLYIEGGNVDFAATATVNISPPGDNPVNWVDGEPVIDGALGVSIWQADSNTATAKMTGTTDGDGIKGCVYFPKNRVEVGGTNFAAGEQLIAHRVLIHGTGDIYISYDGRNSGVVTGKSVLVR